MYDSFLLATCSADRNSTEPTKLALYHSFIFSLNLFSWSFIANIEALGLVALIENLNKINFSTVKSSLRLYPDDMTQPTSQEHPPEVPWTVTQSITDLTKWFITNYLKVI